MRLIVKTGNLRYGRFHLFNLTASLMELVRNGLEIIAFNLMDLPHLYMINSSINST